MIKIRKKASCTYFLPFGLIEKIKEYSQKHGISQGEVVRSALFEFFDKHEEKIGE
ncbi:MAG: hypothetical protein QXD43_03035 [Candidatus Aenigmatarchaeota archaeon]